MGLDLLPVLTDTTQLPARASAVGSLFTGFELQMYDSSFLETQAALKFLDAKLTAPPRPEGPQASRVPLSAESRAILLRVLAGAAPNLAPEVAAEVARLTAIAQGVGGVPGQAAAPAQPLFPQDVEDEANDNFQKVFGLPWACTVLTGQCRCLT